MVREEISFDEIAVGDRLRVTYVEGSMKSGWIGGGVQRSVASVAALGALDKVWLNEGGHVIAHREWAGMKIFKLTN